MKLVCILAAALLPGLLLAGCSKEDPKSYSKVDYNKDGKIIFEELIVVFPDLTVEEFLIADADNRIITVNQAFTRITGYASEDVVGLTPRILKSGRHDDAFYRAMWTQINDTGSWAGEIWNRRKDGAVYPEWLTISAVRN